MTGSDQAQGDFGYRTRPIQRDQVVGIFDFVGFTKLGSNIALLHAVTRMQTELAVELEGDFHWGEIDTRRNESARNDAMLRSTGDGYVLAFSQHHSSYESLAIMTRLHSAIREHHPVRLGISSGPNYIVSDVNDRMNIIGWGINTAARALSVAKSNQIICTSWLAEPLIGSHKDVASSMLNIGTHEVKHGQELQLYNYFKRGSFGAATKDKQRSAHPSRKKTRRRR